MNPARKLTSPSAIALALVCTACTGADPGTRPDPSPSPGNAATSATPPAGPVDLVGVEGPLEPGSYALAIWGETKAVAPLPRAIVEVPEGFFSNGGWVIDAGSDASEPDQLGVLQVWRVDQVLTDPCRRSTATHVGPTAESLATALVRQRGPSTRPQRVTLGGARGLYLEVAVPADTDLAECTDGGYPLWLARPSEAQGHSDPGVVHHLWILDVDGTRLVVVASTYPDQSRQQDTDLLRMAQSVRFEPAPA